VTFDPLILKTTEITKRACSYSILIFLIFTCNVYWQHNRKYSVLLFNFNTYSLLETNLVITSLMLFLKLSTHTIAHNYSLPHKSFEGFRWSKEVNTDVVAKGTRIDIAFVLYFSDHKVHFKLEIDRYVGQYLGFIGIGLMILSASIGVGKTLLYSSRIQTTCARKRNKASQDSYLTTMLAGAVS